MQSRTSGSVAPLALPSLQMTGQPSNQSMFALAPSMWSPFHIESGHKWTQMLLCWGCSQVLNAGADFFLISLSLFRLERGSVESTP